MDRPVIRRERRRPTRRRFSSSKSRERMLLERPIIHTRRRRGTRRGWRSSSPIIPK